MSLRLSRLGAVFGGALWLAGCATVTPIARISPPTNGFAFSGGRGVQDFAAPPSATQAAVLDAMSDLEMRSIRRAHDGAATQFEARTKDNRQVVVTVRSHQGTSQVGSRIGWFGDEPLSQALMERVGVRLGSRPPEAIPAEPPSAPSANPIFSREAVPDAVMLRDLVEAPYRDRVIP